MNNGTGTDEVVQQLPPLSERYRRALLMVLHDYSRRADTLAVIVAGSIIRGEGSTTSDLDFWIVIDSDYRQRKNFLVGDVPVEVFMNPPEQVLRCIAVGDYHAMHMMGHGLLLWVREGHGPLVARLRQWCRSGFALGPRPLGDETRTAQRYAIIDQVQDAFDILRTDPSMANLLLEKVVDMALALYYAERRVWLPKGKRLLADLRGRDAVLAARIERFAALAEPDQRHQLLLTILDHIMGHGRYGWEDWSWESPLERVR